MTKKIKRNKELENKKIEWIKSRRSLGNLKNPAPSKDEIIYAIDCAMSAPDHKKLKPWRFIVTSGESRHELAQAFLKSEEVQTARKRETLSAEKIEKVLKMPLRAPVIITVVTKMSYHEKVPPFEQMLSTGACIQNLILALQAQGYGTIWRTGLLSNEQPMKDYFSVGADDYVAGMIYVGTNPSYTSTRSCADTSNYVKFED